MNAFISIITKIEMFASSVRLPLLL